MHYQSAGTVEFIYDNSTGEFYFLEVNTRLQVEHGVTEEVTGVDLVEWMVRQAAGEMPPLGTIDIRPSGCSIQVRIYAEDPAKNFQPSAGRLTQVVWPTDARVETWVESGTEVTPFYDPMLAKIIVHGETRDAALSNVCDGALAECRTRRHRNQPRVPAPGLRRSGIRTGRHHHFVPARLSISRNAIDVIEPGTQTTIQDYPGRLGYWHVGVPPSGPMDALAFRIANRLVGNPEGAAGLEITVTGPTCASPANRDRPHRRGFRSAA